MNLELARKLIAEQAKYVRSVVTDLVEYNEDYEDTINGYAIEEICFSEEQAVDCNMDMSKSWLSLEEWRGGEGHGAKYYAVFKLHHPDHPVMYIRYSGEYDSWSGVEWDDCCLVEPREVTSIEFFPLQ